MTQSAPTAPAQGASTNQLAPLAGIDRLASAIAPAVIAVAVITAAFFFHVKTDPVPFSENAFQNLGSVLAPLFAVAAFIERAVEVLLTPYRAEHSDRLQLALDAIAADPAKKAEADVLRAELLAYKAQSQRYAFRWAIGLGMVASVLGVRGLAGLVAKDAPSPGLAFEIYDIVLTGLLIGGGSDGIHKVVSALTDYMDMVSKKSQAAAKSTPNP